MMKCLSAMAKALNFINPDELSMQCEPLATSPTTQSNVLVVKCCVDPLCLHPLTGSSGHAPGQETWRPGSLQACLAIQASLS